ncbi:hypothetical protein V5O48_014971 [Marasmius crinis-equi]|uniref:F-box domain-containing protein n=1 Tax=Marasmius crinis-equi TaxID=585013 RepID=A0ABR3EVU0_9AGAR
MTLELCHSHPFMTTTQSEDTSSNYMSDVGPEGVLEGSEQRKQDDLLDDSEKEDEALKRMKETVETGGTGIVDRLPTEILGEVFKCCPYLESTFCPWQTPWVLGQVCRRWRQLSMNLPELWTKVYLDLWTIIDNFGQDDTASEILKEALRRTADQKLRITITACDIEPITEQKHLLGVLCSTRPRWISLALQGVASSGLWQLYPVQGDSEGFTSLEEVDILEMSYWEHDRRLLKALENAPKLRSIFIHSEMKDEPLFNWANLTEFFVPPDSCHWWAHRLALCTRLETLVFRLRNHNDPVNFRGIIRLDTLRVLRLDYYEHEGYGEDAFDICAILQVPALHSLEINTTSGSGTDLQNLIAMFERSPPANLRSIAIWDVSLTDVTIARLLKATPGVTHLTLRGWMLPYLLTAIASGKVLPNIEHLHFGVAVHCHNNGFLPLPGLTRTALDNLVRVGTPTSTLRSVRVVQTMFTKEIALIPGRAALSSIMMQECSDLTEERARKRMEEDVTPELFEFLFESILCKAGPLTPVIRRNMNENIELLQYALATVEKCKTGLFDGFVDHFTKQADRIERSHILNGLIESGCDAGEAWALIKQQMLTLGENYHPVRSRF